MKQTKLLFTVFAAFCCITTINAQLYMNSTGQITIGSTNAANSGYAMQSYGNVVFSTASGSGNSAPCIIASNGYTSASAPDFSWYGDAYTGMYHPSTGNVSFSTNNYNILGLSYLGWGEASFNNSNTSTSQYPLAVTSYVNATTTITWQLIENSTNKNFYVYGSGSEWAVSNNTISDARLKQNINTIQNALSKVMQLRGVTYNFIPRDSGDFYKKNHLGLIAQEVMKVVPEAVSMGQDSIYGIEYGNLVGLLVEAIKAQNGRIDSLKNALAECCNRNHDRTQKTSPDTGNGGSGSQFQNLQMQQSNLPQNLQGASLSQNAPNPFTQSTTIACYIPQQSNAASIMVFDMNGTLKKTFPINGKGSQNVVISGNQLIAGMYFYTLIIDNTEIATRKMILTQ